MTLDDLYNIILERKAQTPEGSYVAGLFKKGTDRIAQKVGEEAVEVVIASKNNNRQEFVGETADLWFHLLILLASQGVTPQDILEELEKRVKK